MNSPAPIGKFVIISGIVLVVVGLLILYGPRIPFVGKLPGDIDIRGEHSRFFFPITTCIVISLILTLILYLISKLR